MVIVELPPPGRSRAEIRLFGGADRFRVESRLGFIASTALYDRTKPAYLTLYPLNRTYLESKPVAHATLTRSHLERYATAPDGNPCGYKQDATCTAAGEEDVNGRRSRRWEAKFGNGKGGTYWVDIELGLIVKATDPQFSFETKDLKIAPQPAELFTAPANYTRKS